MDVGTLQRRIFDLGIVTAFAGMVFVASAAIGGRPAMSDEGRKSNKTFPVLATSTTCESELSAYATALISLEAAQAVAEQAYEDWYLCEYGVGPEPEPEPEPEPFRSKYHLPSLSILER